MTTKYSAIVPNYNDGSKIAQSLGSLVAQAVPFHEIIIIDDASTDNSVKIIYVVVFWYIGFIGNIKVTKWFMCANITAKITFFCNLFISKYFIINPKALD